MGDERSVPQADTQYPGIDHKVLKQWTDQGEPADANGFGDMWREFGRGLSESAENLMVAVFGSEAGWTGQAANAMRAQLKKVADWSLKTGDSFQTASRALDEQGTAVGTAKNSMPDPVDYNPGQMIKDAAKSGNIVEMALLPVNMYKQQQAQQQAHEKAIQVVAQRDAELAAAAASIPSFEPPPKIDEQGGKPPEPNQPGMPGTPGGRPGVPGNGSRGGVGGGGGGGAGGGGMPGFPGGAFGGGGGFGGNDPNNPNGNGDDPGQTPPNVNLPSLPIGSGTGTSGYSNPTSFGPGPGGPTGIPGGPGPAGGGGGFNSAFGGGFGPGGAPRPGGGFGAMGPGAAGSGAGSGAAAGPGGVGGGRGAGMAGGRGAGGMGAGGMGAGRGQGGEDDEHQRPSYLVEPDPDATFGTDQMTAPPVIGG
ncbi:hypothetical protein JOF56_001664 [Kibdelosporangium banguiense]|uniref:PPE family domain-containing protein n=1 Tax=Kibdelosporangium banguiense TaxID=1365924 RepID=A0ABS4TBB5_9PSEU|nr:hypothetical protein [Kibdelosporangium banguiense]MBP2321279.1 hypothetical protein [Kibdelosporangium banguiense]